MKIVIIPSAFSMQSYEYRTILTKQGFECAENICDILKDLQCDIIYSSPFIRSLQTIYPFCIKNKKKVNQECSFYPINRMDNKNNYYSPAPISCSSSYFEYLTPIINKDYKSKIFHSNVRLNESDREIKNRIFPFLYSLKKTYMNTNKTIFLVIHSDICPYFLKFFNIEDNSFQDIHIMDFNSNHRYHKHIAMSKFELQ